MSIDDVMGELERAGSVRQRKALERAGAKPPMFGATGAVHRAIARRVVRDQALAEALWRTGNFDARVVATLIADPRVLAGRVLAEWIATLDCAPLADGVARVAALHPGGLALAAGWRASADPWTCAVGWSVLAHRADQVDDAEVPRVVGELERGAAAGAPCVRAAMASLLVALAARSDRVRTIAVEAARRLTRAGLTELAGVEAAVEAARAAHAGPAAARGRRRGATVRTSAAKARRPRR